jgi:acyl carrier protein
MTKEVIGEKVIQFIRKNFLFDETKVIDENVSLLGSGIVDSTGILELIIFLENTFQVKFADNELVADNFDSIANITSFLSRKIPEQTK